MWSKVNGPKNVLAGAIYVATGLILFFWSQHYAIGTATRMGPGYFPALLGVVLCLFGLIAIAQGLLAKKPDPIEPIKIEPLALIFLSVISFGLLIERAGMVIAIGACIAIACFRRLLTNPVEVLLMYLALIAFIYLVFIRAFDMNMRVFWWD